MRLNDFCQDGMITKTASKRKVLDRCLIGRSHDLSHQTHQPSTENCDRDTESCTGRARFKSWHIPIKRNINQSHQVCFSLSLHGRRLGNTIPKQRSVSVPQKKIFTLKYTAANAHHESDFGHFCFCNQR